MSTNTPRIRTTEEIAKGIIKPYRRSLPDDLILGSLYVAICNAIDLERKRAEGLVEALEYYAHFFDSKEGRYRKEDMVNKPDFFIVNLPQVAESAIAAYKQEPS